LKRDKRRLLTGVALILLSVVLTSGTLAMWVVEAPSVHIINMGRLRGEIVEEYTPPTDLVPGVAVDKVANVKNKGDLDMVVRVKITTAWGSERGTDGKVIADPTLSTDNILLGLNDTYWLDGGDGYYYYKGILKPGEMSAEPLLKWFKVSEETGNAYKNKMADIIVSLECLQAGGNALEEVWNRTYTELGFASPGPYNKVTTYVTFVDPDTGFTFNPDTTDLFANFKDLVPGDTREQLIRVRNAYTTRVMISLKAEFIEQSLATPATLALVTELLREHARIVVTDETRQILYEGAIWGNYENALTPGKPDSMRDYAYIPVGIFTPDQVRDLTVALTVSPEMDEQYMDLWGLIKWMWHAEDVDREFDPTPTPTPTDSPTPTPTPSGPVTTPTPRLGDDGPKDGPKTGDYAVERGLWLALLILSGVLGIYLCIPRRTKNRYFT
jgi:hypothetical protein